MSAIRVATAQFGIGTHRDSDVEQNLAKVLRFIDRACAPADGGPKPELVLLPEHCNHPSRYQNQDHAYEMAVTIPGPFVDAVAERARRYSTHIALNVTVRGDCPRVYDTTILIGPQGKVIGTHEKQYLFAHEQDGISIGRYPAKVYETSIGQIGLYICMDGLIPETTRCLAVQGAQVLVNPLNSAGPDEEALHVPARAAENHVWVISANNVGPISGGHARSYVGGSQIIDPEGRPVARASMTEEEIVYATIDPAAADDKRAQGAPGDGNDLLADRRPELYGLLTVPNDELPVTKLPAGELLPRVRASAVQVSFDGDTARTIRAGLAVTRDVIDAGSRLIVLPELFPFDPAEIAADPAAAAQVSEHVLRRFQSLASDAGAWLVANLVEAADGRYFSTAYLIGERGEITGRYRQVHLWATERRWATAGDEFPVFKTPYGQIGMLIGYDGVLPETARMLTLQGADILVYPCTWRLEWMPRLGIVERAAENRTSIVAAARADSPVQRGSMIVQADRFPTFPHWWIRSPVPAECAPGNGTSLSAGLAAIYGRDKRDHDRTDQVRNRRPELYEVLVRSTERVGA